MAIRFCGDAALHAAHRWPYAGTFGERDEYCLGQHGQDEGGWLSPLHRRGDHRKAHFFLSGADRSICGYGHTGQGDLPFDPQLSCTTVPDPRLGEPRYRGACILCQKAVR